jgi:hypothetical protein
MFDTDKAFKLVEYDLDNLVFVNYPYERELIKEDSANWLNSVKQKLDEDNYVPSACVIAEVPKGKGAVRPGSVLTIEDLTAYTSIVGAAYTQIHQELKWAQGKVDYAYRLKSATTEALWFRDQFNGWNDFKKNSLKLIKNGSAYVVITDITGYYENIDHSLLLSDLRQINAPNEVIENLRKCLVEWAQLKTKGIPQGTSASHLLAKLYLNPIDQELKDLGYTHYRYVDDFRIFCNSHAEAKKALMDLAGLLRRRGLNLQSAKSKIYRADEAKPEIEGTATLIEGVNSKIMKQHIAQNGYPYSISMAVNMAVPNEEQLKTIQDAFMDFFIIADDSDFDKTLFHYLLNKLGRANDSLAVDYCLELLERHPEETGEILKYFARVGAGARVLSSLTGFVSSETAVYDYQNFKIIEWLLANNLSNAQLLTLVRKDAFDNNKPGYYRAICLKLLGAKGSATDLGRIEHAYPSATFWLDECSLICNLKRMERGRRNTFLARVNQSTDYHKWACAIAKR